MAAEQEHNHNKMPVATRSRSAPVSGRTRSVTTAEPATPGTPATTGPTEDQRTEHDHFMAVDWEDCGLPARSAQGAHG